MTPVAMFVKVRHIAAAAVLAASLTGTAAAQEIAAAPADDPPPAAESASSLPVLTAPAPLSATPAADTASLLGAWTAVDPATGMHEVLTVTADTITFGAAPPLPYRVERDGENLALWLADADTPARFHFFDAANAQLSVPGGPAIALRRAPPPDAPAPAVVKVPESDTIADAAAALLPPSAPFP